MWSKTKKKLESYLCDSLKDRLEYHCSNYRIHDGIGRAYVTLDKNEILNMCTLKRDYYRTPLEGVFSQVEFIESARIYFNLSIEEALRSEDPLIRMMSVLDRRVGKRKLKELQLEIENEHELVKYMFGVRCKAEALE